MKYSLKLFVTITFIFATSLSFSQVLVNTNITNTISGSNVFLDGSQFSVETGAAPNEGKGFIVPSVNLVNFEFNLSLADGSTFPTYFDGMVVYNNTNGITLTTGERSSTATAVVPGFYYFSNPNGGSNGNISAGRWLPLGSSAVSVKTKEVFVTTPSVYNEAKLNLGTAVIGADEVVTFLGAKIYEAGKLIMTADSDYITNTNVLTTGNGYMFQLLKANTQYKVVVEYK